MTLANLHDDFARITTAGEIIEALTPTPREAGLAVSILVNIDVPDLAAAARFYTEAFGLGVHRRFGTDGGELAGWPVPRFLLEKAASTVGAGQSLRT